MNSKTKIKAFTLSEMVVVLILTAIVIGLAFSVLTLVQKQMWAIQQNYDRNLTIKKFETALWIDFNRYQNIIYDNLENQLKFSSRLDSTQYHFQEDYVVKKNDTFRLSFAEKQFYFNGESADKGKIDALKFILTKDQQSQTLFIFKKNTSADFMNN